MTISGYWFYGHEVSAYGKQCGYVDYATLAKAFDAVLNNDIMQKTYDIGYWEQESGFIDHTEEIDSLLKEIDDIENSLEEWEDDDSAKAKEERNRARDVIKKLTEEIEELENDQDYLPDVYQWYIVSDNGARLLEEVNEIVYYNEELDIYLWGVTHYGTAWDYVLTDIKIKNREEE